MSEVKHKYKTEITLAGCSGETGEPIMEVVFRQRYEDKATQASEQMKFITKCFAGIFEVSEERALAEVPGLAEKLGKSRGR